MLNVTDLNVKIARKTILSSINCHARPGQVTTIVGPNGSGKSTLMRAISGELTSEGEITLNGLNIRNAKAWELAEHRAVLPQSTPMSFPFQVREVVRLGLLSVRDQEEAMQSIRQALRRVGLTDYETRLYQELSGGEQQRTQLARVLCQVHSRRLHEMPRWLFLDEPVASLDIAHQLQVMDIARDFADGGGGVVIVIHDLNLAAMFADHVIIMDQGKMVIEGSVATSLRDDILQQVYGCPVRVSKRPPRDAWFFLPQSVERSAIRRSAGPSKYV